MSRTLPLALMWVFCVVTAKKYVIRSPKLAQSLELDEVLAEKTVESAAACGQLCAADPVCHTVMLIGQQCLLFAYLYSHCPAEVTTVDPIPCSYASKTISADLDSRYIIGQHSSVTSFQTALEYCQSLGGHSVHISSSVEHQAVVTFVTETLGLDCTFIWTGGWTDYPETDPAASTWKWIRSFGDPDPIPVTYIDWATHEPDNVGGAQHALALVSLTDYKFADVDNKHYSGSHCYVCECP